MITKVLRKDSWHYKLCVWVYESEYSLGYYDPSHYCEHVVKVFFAVLWVMFLAGATLTVATTLTLAPLAIFGVVVNTLYITMSCIAWIGVLITVALNWSLIPNRRKKQLMDKICSRVEFR